LGIFGGREIRIKAYKKEIEVKISSGVKNLIIINVIVFIFQFIPGVTSLGALVPENVFIKGELWRLVTNMFMHSTSDPFHIIFNMLGLWVFGQELESKWGTRKFVTMYLIFGTGASLFSIFYLMANYHTACIGASGAVFGLMTAYAMFHPNRELWIFGVLPVRAWVLVIVFFGISLMYSFSNSGTAHLIHLGGIVTAYLCLKANFQLPRLGHKKTETVAFGRKYGKSDV
jgi:membrane associated rhomboid family serine protease